MLTNRFTRALKQTNITRLLTRTSATSTAKSPTPQKKPVYNGDSFILGLYTNGVILDHVHPYPNVLDEDQSENLSVMVDSLEEFMTGVNNPDESDKKSEIDPEVWEAAKELGAFGLLVPEEYDGMGMCNTEYARMSEILLREDGGFSIAIGAHQSIGYKAILILGNEQQKRKYLPKLAVGEWIAAFALTEPTTGSDASSVKCRAEKSADGKHYVLNGSKIWISNGGIADIFTVFAKTKQPDGTDKMNAFIVERAFGGLTHGPPENKMGIKASNTAEVFFENVKIPAENLICNEGDGFKVAMEVLNNGRFGMATGLCGAMSKCIDMSVDHAKNREQFGSTIDNYGAIQEKIARMSLLHYASESMGYVLCGSMDNKAVDYGLEAACCKIFASEAAWWCCDEAIQVLGGMGYMRDTGLERMMRDLRIFRIFEGTNDILRLFVALTGMKSLGKTMGDVQGLQKAVKNMDIGGISKGVSWLYDHSRKRDKMNFNLSDKMQVNRELRSEVVQVDKIIKDFQWTCTEILMKYQKGIIKPENQMMIRKLADTTISIYSMSCVLSRADRAITRGDASAAHEALMAQAWVKDQTAQCKLWLDQAIKDKSFHSDLTQISKNVVENGTKIQPHPLGV